MLDPPPGVPLVWASEDEVCWGGDDVDASDEGRPEAAALGEDREEDEEIPPGGVETVVLRLEVEMKRLRGGGGLCEEEEAVGVAEEEVGGREEVGRALLGEDAVEEE